MLGIGLRAAGGLEGIQITDVDTPCAISMEDYYFSSLTGKFYKAHLFLTEDDHFMFSIRSIALVALDLFATKHAPTLN